jgi:CheY-like chemotaxis protein
MNVLLVEDDPVLTDGLSRVLNSHGFTVHTVNNGHDALSQRFNAAVLVLDIGLPGIDGFEVLRRMRAAGNNTPVLLLTARDTIPDRVHGLELGADDYLVKPFATPELVARIKALIRRSAPQPAQLTVGGLSLDNATKRADIDGRKIEPLHVVDGNIGRDQGQVLGNRLGDLGEGARFGGEELRGEQAGEGLGEGPRAVRLAVQVHQQDRAALFHGQPGQVDGEGRFADAPLLVRNRECLHGYLSRSCRKGGKER